MSSFLCSNELQKVKRLLGALVLWCRGFVPENFLEEAVAEGSSNMAWPVSGWTGRIG